MSGSVAIRGIGARRDRAAVERREWARWSSAALAVANRRAERRWRVRWVARGWLGPVAIRRSVGLAVLVVFGLSVMVAGWSMVGASPGPASAAEETGERPAGMVVRVAPGESLWVISRRALPRQDPRVGVELLKSANSLSSDRLQVGQLLRIPAE